MDNNLVTAIKRGDKHKTPEKKNFRYLTLAECKSLHGRVTVLDRYADYCQVTITSIKTWKTRPDVRIGWKFGLYEYGSELITSDNDNRFFVAEVEPNDTESINSLPASCPTCNSESIILLGILGRRVHYRCQNCGIEFSHAD